MCDVQSVNEQAHEGELAKLQAENEQLKQSLETLSVQLKVCSNELFTMISKHNIRDLEDGSWAYDYQTPMDCDRLIKEKELGL